MNQHTMGDSMGIVAGEGNPKAETSRAKAEGKM